ncbi:hypothetical protein [Anaeromyxobacter diazotrophicus]|uniref:Uncharacterized protein n=1 Tax=Anaeromyxobacter diazotrophicus TaxID=2590199 RepID=A0A7I9VL62_9BACT|nr:hypothetical protein [Anaeromyxobacter diazotrophicus]GEJ56928.1 hypothetical protein AMYX_16690 [Anaeromyxobacter diazotrophicus]
MPTQKTLDDYRGLAMPKLTDEAIEKAVERAEAMRELHSASTPLFQPTDTPYARARRVIDMHRALDAEAAPLDGEDLTKFLAPAPKPKKEG